MAGKFNKHKQDGGHPGFPIRMILATVDLQVTSILHAMVAILDFRSEWLPLIYKYPQCFQPSFESTGLSVLEKKRKIGFQDGHHLGFPIGTILAIFDLQVTYMLPTKFRVKWPSGSGEEANKRAMMALYRSPEYHSTQGEYDLIRGTFLQNYFEIRP